MGAVCGWGFGWWRLDRFASGVLHIGGGVFGGDPEPGRGTVITYVVNVAPSP